MKLSPKQKKLLIAAGVAVVVICIWRTMKKASDTPVVIGNKTLVSPESTITVSAPTIKPASKTFSMGFVDSLPFVGN